ncbi:polysaccharide deacetylase [Thermosipho melanesiensis]|uniref:Polysaccharide deacetylase n=2 Tax=Thermosipho melanesiensis TaxID=46541 RepID=A6LJZ3_THEM4|nr:polysaccharide deacetylase family protein [Thermosipho melanesiensis]ABR30244.1 polysaccharide deacetylase [Thermosipho melanesiensis BI429]APT73432.1 polysaccharide deacetylase [Thermosipho melanesiensis]OOC37375.1 polysaccharide deacetylase [Thermosipho melanesiensis]OOC39737.1 polysaccharide deacetylase [Thermosipho melanesiensis]OOC39842.1 polysaccharide deacetylase [Thermosipho melanesiensis]
MKKWILLFLLISYISFSNIVIFIYHRFDDERYLSTNTWTSELEMHIKLVKKLGYSIWTLKDLEDYIYGNKKEENAVIFTIDDGYITTYTKAFPIFKKYNVPFSVFLYFGGVGHSKEYLSWDMVKKMADYGVEFGHHSVSHDKFPFKNIDYFEKDLVEGLKIWKEHMGTSLKYYAYPYGYYNQEMIEVLKKHGFKLAFIQLSGAYSKEISPYEIPREPLLQDWATESHVRYILSRKPLVLKEKPYYWKNGKLYIKAHLEGFKNPVVYIREKGIVKSEFKNGVLTAGPFEIENEINSLMLSVRGENKKEYVRYYLIIRRSFDEHH